MVEEPPLLPYKVVHIHQNQTPFEVGCSSINRAFEVAQIQLDTHSKHEDRAGSLRGDGIVKYYEGGACTGQVEIMIWTGGEFERIAG